MNRQYWAALQGDEHKPYIALMEAGFGLIMKGHRRKAADLFLKVNMAPGKSAALRCETYSPLEHSARALCRACLRDRALVQARARTGCSHANADACICAINARRTHGAVQAYEGKGKAWSCRHLFLRGYTDTLIMSHIPGPAFRPSDADLQALLKVSKDSSLPVMDRVHADYLRGQLLFDQGRVAEAAKANLRLLKTAGAATPEERAALHATVGPDGLRWRPAAESLDCQVQDAKENLLTMDSRTRPAERPQDPDMIFHEVTWPVAAEDGCTGDGDARFKAELDNAMRQRRLACSNNACGARDVPLSCCRKCKLAYYCSPACQRAGWNEHKPQCRAPGEHVAGDVVLLQHLQARPELNGQFFRVLGPDPGKVGRWQVSNPRLPGKPLLSVRESSMQHVLTH